MKQAYPKTGLYLTVQPILEENVRPLRDLSAQVAAMLPPCPENEDYLAVLNQTSHAETRRQRFTALRCLLSLMEATAPEILSDLRLYRDGQGRPYGVSKRPDSPAFDFNLTHTQGYAACALLLGEGKVGIDAETPISPERSRKISDRFFTSAEKTHLQTVDEDLYAREMTRLWTAKEALSKQDGRGYPLNFDSMGVAASLRLHHFTLTEAEESAPLYITLCAPASAGDATVVKVSEHRLPEPVNP